MKSVNLINNVYSHNLAQDGSAQIEIMEQFESTYPLLKAYLSYLRQINGIQHKIDVLNQNAQILKEFNHLCENNLLFFLTITVSPKKSHLFI